MGRCPSELQRMKQRERAEMESLTVRGQEGREEESKREHSGADLALENSEGQ